jgi:hypothetical protein
MLTKPKLMDPFQMGRMADSGVEKRFSRNQ